ncbi:DUF1629 domain-containing protein [Xanthomonas nasturtii]|uniref:DUF1629 domain-containing protein n=1 Tax=Xanthomonas nasturtii TaxID=1843581 RepID=A0ABT0LVP0_9XANT|nr:DUF1629 domain-containing protein [Xanthomonas nasturtii]MCL1553391.1 DUF1629 domain-containing protein [Xanthomonas nasturtii]MCL1555549.1 DUF1629 domain-containing protein [Xanthomonas nasturtii]
MTFHNKPQKGEFFALTLDSRAAGPGHGVVFDNENELLTPPKRSLRPWEGGFPPLREKPRLIYDPTKGAMPQHLEGTFSGYWLVSESLKSVFERVDPLAFEFAETDFLLADGSPGPTYFLCDVVRALDAIDEENSELRIERGSEYVNGKAYNFSGGASLAFRKDVIGSAHIFQLRHSFSIFCDRVMLDTIRSEGISTADNSGGLWFSDAADWSDV